MTELNSLYAHYLIENSIRQQPSGPAYHNHGVIHPPETRSFHALRRVRAAITSRLQEQVDIPVGTPVTTAFLANIKNCV